MHHAPSSQPLMTLPTPISVWNGLPLGEKKEEYVSMGVVVVVCTVRTDRDWNRTWCRPLGCRRSVLRRGLK